MIIDLEHHLPTEEQLLKKGAKPGRTQRVWDPDGKLRNHTSLDASRVELHLQFMDEAGIDMAVLSGNVHGDLDDCRNWNNYCAKLIKAHPTRFAGFADVVPFGGEPAFDEMERAVKKLGMKGFHIYAQIEGRNLDSRELWPFYEKVSELGVPLNVHIASTLTGFDALHAPYGLYYVMAREFGICAATFRVCLGGVLEDFPNLVFIMNHFGGGISAIKERMDLYMNYVGPDFPSFYKDKTLISKSWNEYFDKLYFNMAGREVGMAAVKCALTNINPNKLIFATDWPLNYEVNPQGVRQYISEIKELDLSPDQIDDMLGGNAARLLRLN
ncbi:amidohydrolase family protein [Chloroflexota bacterium]